MRLFARASGPLRGRTRPPSDKSISHRALIFGALARGPCHIENLLPSADVLATAEALRALGVIITRQSGGSWHVMAPPAWHSPDQPLDFGNSGTGVRLTMGALAGRPCTAHFTGDSSLRGRPMGRVLEPLARMGAIAQASAGARLPIALTGLAEPNPISHESAIASAQVKSAILLCGLQADGPTEVIEPTRSRDHTERMARSFGAEIGIDQLADGRWRAQLRGKARLEAAGPVHVPGDPSSAAFAAAAAILVPGSDLVFEQIGLNPLRIGAFAAMQAMGADLAMIDLSPTHAPEPIGEICVRHGPALRGCAPDPAGIAAFIDEVPILAVLAAFAEGETRITGAADLRHKESDRIAMTVAGLRACGVEAQELPDGLVINGQGPSRVRGGAAIETHGDHRIAMSFLVLGLAARQPVIVDQAEMIATSFPDFVGFMQSLGADISEAE